MTTPSVYEYPDQLENCSSRNDDMSYDNDADRDDDQTTSAEYEILLQEAIEADLKETELTGLTADASVMYMAVGTLLPVSLHRNAIVLTSWSSLKISRVFGIRNLELCFVILLLPSSCQCCIYQHS